MLTAIWGVASLIGFSSWSQSRPAESQPATRYAVPVDRPWWVREGLVIASVGEGLSDRAFRTTRGRTRTPTFNERESLKRERSEEVLKRLKELGVNLVLVPFGGYGPEAAEAEEREMSRATVARCHGLGLRCGVWIPVGEIDAASWKQAGKDVSDWLVLNRSGAPAVGMGFGRSILSDAVDAVRERSRRMAEDAGKIGADAVFVPNWRVPAGYEAAARTGFGAYLRAARASTAMVTLFEKSGLPTDGAAALVRPWVGYRVGLLEASLGEIARTARQEKGEMLMGVDCLNPARQIGIPDGPAVDPPGLLRGIEGVTTSARPQVSERGEIRTQIAELKSAAVVGTRCVPRVLSNLVVAQQLAFGGDCGGIAAYFDDGNLAGDDEGRVELTTSVVESMRRYRARRELYAEMSPVADVLVWQPRDVRLHSGPAAEVEQTRAVNALITHRIPFSFLYDELPRDLKSDAAVLLAGMPEVTEDPASDLRAFVSRGGAVVVVGPSAVVDSAGKVVGRELAEYLTEASSGAAPASQAEGRAGVVVRRSGDGRVVSIAAPGAAMNVWMTRRSSSKGRTAPALEQDDLAVAIRSGLGRGLSVEGALDRGGAIELTRSGDGRRTVLHVVNFNPDGALRGEALKVRVKDAASVSGVWRYGGATDGYEAAAFRRGAGEVAIEMKPVDLYDAYLIEQK